MKVYNDHRDVIRECQGGRTVEESENSECNTVIYGMVGVQSAIQWNKNFIQGILKAIRRIEEGNG